METMMAHFSHVQPWVIQHLWGLKRMATNLTPLKFIKDVSDSQVIERHDLFATP